MLSIGPPVASLANPEMVAISLPISQYKGLGFVNFIQGFTFPCGELQSRYLLKVFKGEVATPSLEEQFVDMEENRNAVCAQFIDRSQLRVLNGNFMQYLLRQYFLLILSPFRSTDLFGGAGTIKTWPTRSGAIRRCGSSSRR